MSRFSSPVSPNPVPQACGFALGTLILTPHGPEFVENLAPGDLVMTQDAGAQPLTRVTRTIPPHIQCLSPRDATGPWRHLWTTGTSGVANISARICVSLQCKAGQVIWAEGLPVALATMTPRATALVMA